MAEAVTALGIACFGIQVCQGLLIYYDGWKAYDTNLDSVHDAVADLTKTLALLKACLDEAKVESKKKERVEECLVACHKGLKDLSAQATKLRHHKKPDSFRQKSVAKVQKAWYPVRGVNALREVQTTVDGLRARLELAMGDLSHSVSTDILCMLRQVAIDVREAIIRTAAIEAQNERLLAEQRAEKFRKITAWLSAPDPWTNHKSTRYRHEPQTGTWLLQSRKYENWKVGDVRPLWLYGKAGWGKTVLYSTVVEDILEYCETAVNSTCAVFYYTFFENQEQSYDSLIRSLVVQLGWKDPSYAKLVEAYNRPNQILPSLGELEKILMSLVESFDEVFLVLDALDECPEDGDVRQNVLECLERLSKGASNVRLLATSRDASDVRDCMELLSAEVISIASHSVDGDIRRWVASQMVSNRKLNRMEAAVKTLIEDTISQKADGM